LEALVRRRAPSQGYAQIIAADCNSASLSVCTFEDSKAVKGVVRIVPQGANPANTKRLYCFDLAFVPHIAVVSAFTSDNATVGTAAREDVPAACPVGFEDAAARTFAANTSDDNQEVGFAIEFM
jgi:hypothetical protein